MRPRAAEKKSSAFLQWELLCPCSQWCANGCNNSQQCWIQPIRLWRSRLTRVRGPNNVGRAVQTDPTSLHYASAIKEQNKCWELLVQTFNRFQTLHNNSQQHATECANGRKIVTSYNVASVCMGLNNMQ